MHIQLIQVCLPGKTSLKWYIYIVYKCVFDYSFTLYDYVFRVPTLYEELNSLTFPDHARNFSLTKLTYNSYFSLHFSRLLLRLPVLHCHTLNH